MMTTNRSLEFSTGMTGTGEVSSSLAADSARFNSKVPSMWSPNGVLQQYMRAPGNGNSTVDAARQTPSGQMPSANGMSASTYAARFPLNFETRVP